MADNKKEVERAELHRTIWAIADEMRGSVDGWDPSSKNSRPSLRGILGSDDALGAHSRSSDLRSFPFHKETFRVFFPFRKGNIICKNKTILARFSYKIGADFTAFSEKDCSGLVPTAAAVQSGRHCASTMLSPFDFAQLSVSQGILPRPLNSSRRTLRSR